MRRILLLLTLGALLWAPTALAGGGEIIRNNQGWTCNSAVNLDLVRVTTPPGDGVSLSTGCTGVIRRLEVTGVRNGDGIKVQNASVNAAHDLLIASMLVSCSGPSTDGTHQDGIQVMGGRNLTFRNYVIDCYGGGGGNIFVQRAGGGVTTPTNIRFEHGAVGPRFGPNGGPSVQFGTQTGGAVVDSLICRQLNGRSNPISGSFTQTGNLLVSSNDPRCANVETLEDWVGNVTPPPPPPPTGCDVPCLEARIAELEEQLAASAANEALLNAEIARLEGILEQIADLALAA